MELEFCELRLYGVLGSWPRIHRRLLARWLIKRTSGSDDLEGRGGNDTLRVQVAGDELWGGPASDFVYGEPRGASVLADETLFGSVPTSQAGNDVIYGGPGREEVDRQTGEDEHGRLGHQPLTSRLPSSNRTSKVSTGSLAGPRSTSPLSTSNSEPWHGQITVLSCRSPSASEHCWWVQVSSKA